MTYTIRYRRPGRGEESALLMIPRQCDFAAYKGRLEAQGFVVLDIVVTPPNEPAA